jgi:hypothetical protein
MTAINCFNPHDKKFFEGLGLRQNCILRGRESELESLRGFIGTIQGLHKTAIAITGIGGIGYLILLCVL